MMRVLVLPAACMHGAFTAGVLAGLESVGIAANYFKAIIGASSGGWNGAYYLAGDLQTKGRRFWCMHVPHGFLSWRRCRPYADLAYLDHLTRHEEPLDTRALRACKTNLFVVVSDMAERRASYIHLNVQADPIRYLIASFAMPIASHPQEIDGARYGDGGLSDALPLRFAERFGADEIWVVLTTPPGYRDSRVGWWIISRLAALSAERALLAASARTYNRALSEIEQRSDLVVIRPSAMLPAGRFTRDPQKMRLLYDTGKNAGMKKARRY